MVTIYDEVRSEGISVVVLVSRFLGRIAEIFEKL